MKGGSGGLVVEGEHEVSMRIKRRMNVTCFLDYVGQRMYK